MIAINGIRLVSKYNSQYKKDQSHRLIKLRSAIIAYIMVTMFFFLSHVTFELQALYIIIFTNISGYINKKFQSIFYIFAIFNMKNLNVCHRNFDVNKNHFNCKTFTTEILDINRIRYNSGEMAEITYPHFDQHYSNQHYSTSHNL